MNTDWRDRALCQRYADLPWIADPQDRRIGATIAMEGICAACPVFSACDAFALAHRVTSGFYAGKDRTPSRQSRLMGRIGDGVA